MFHFTSHKGQPLSDRELQVIRLVAGELTNREIAARLGISERTVQAHVHRALRKIGARSRVGLAVWAVREDLLVPNAECSGAEREEQDDVD